MGGGPLILKTGKFGFIKIMFLSGVMQVPVRLGKILLRSLKRVDTASTAWISEDGQRLILLHNHLFKNAGSSIDWVLRESFGQAFVDHRDDTKMVKGAKYLKGYLQCRPSIAALSSHHLCFPLPEICNTRLFCLTMFRHPIERVTSVYNFERHQRGVNTYGARFARDHSLREYVLWRMQPEVPPVIRNFHVIRSLSHPVKWRKPLGEKELEQAKRFVDSIDLLGLVEDFDRSMVLFEQFLKPFLSGVDLSYKRQNVGQTPGESRDERITRLKRTIGEDVFEQLCLANRLDMELYAYVENVFQKRLDRVAELNQKLENFRRRCTSL